MVAQEVRYSGSGSSSPGMEATKNSRAKSLDTQSSELDLYKAAERVQSATKDRICKRLRTLRAAGKFCIYNMP